MRSVALPLLVVLALLPVPSVNAADAEELSARLVELEENIDAAWQLSDDRKLATAAASEYRRLFGTPPEPARFSTAQAAVHYDAAITANFYALDTDILDDIRRLFSLLERRNEFTEEQRQWYHYMLVAHRQFREANALLDRYPEMERSRVPLLPRGVEPNTDETIVLAVSGSPPQFSARHVDLTDGKQVVITARPGCHFTQDAFGVISEDPELRPLLSDALLVNRPGGNPDYSRFVEWQQKYPDFPIHPVVNVDPWPIPEWRTPVFYFFDDGRIVGKVLGWPGGGKRDELLAMARQWQDDELEGQ